MCCAASPQPCKEREPSRERQVHVESIPDANKLTASSHAAVSGKVMHVISILTLLVCKLMARALTALSPGSR